MPGRAEFPRLTCSALHEEANKPSLYETERRCCLLLLKLAGSLPEAVPPRHSGNHRPTEASRQPGHSFPRIVQQARPGIGTEELIPLPFPAAQLRMKLEFFVLNKQEKKRQKNPDKLRNWHILLLRGRCFTTQQLRRKCRNCPAVLGSILTWQRLPKAAPKQPELQKTRANRSLLPSSSSPGQALGVNFLRLLQDSEELGEIH